MSTGNWLNTDNLYLKFGTSKATSEVAGDYNTIGSNRVMEATIDLTTLSGTVAIVSDTMIFPAGPGTGRWYIEAVELVVETAATSTATPTLSVGLIQLDRSTVPTNYGTAFINAQTFTGKLDTAGQKVTYTNGTTCAGGLIGTEAAATTGPYYLTATGTSTAFTAGSVKVRVLYHGKGTINQ